MLAIRVFELISVDEHLLVRRFPPVRGVGNDGGAVKGVGRTCVILIGCNIKCVLGSVDEVGGVKYQTDIPMVRSGNLREAITRVVVIPKRGKRKGAWMGSGKVCASLPGEVGDALLDDASGGVINSGVVEKVYM